MGRINKELWLLLSLFGIAAVLNSLADSQRMILALYFLPVLYSAYHFGRRHATLTAFASVVLVVGLTYFNPTVFSRRETALSTSAWFEIALWGGILVVSGYAMGTLYERNQKALVELRDSYNGMLVILQQFLANQKYSQNHSYRVSVCAIQIGEAMGLEAQRVDDVRAAALLRNVNELGISNEVLMRAANLTREEVEKSLRKGTRTSYRASTAGGSLRRVIQIVLAQQALAEHRVEPQHVPMEVHILTVADAYESLTNGAKGNAMSPVQAEETILASRGTEYEPRVVDAFVQAFGERARGASASK
jgi:HD-GYP domain-containing protein (c-di-GMP phosphodiesterase class II)